MTTLMTDPASEVVTAIITTMKAVFSDGSESPPVGGGSNKVLFFAGEGAPIEEISCDQPLLWARLVSRYRSDAFPEPSTILSPCGGQEVIVVEIGVARCSMIGGDATPDQYAAEAEISLDDSWRIGRVMCALKGVLSSHQLGSDMVNPYGPEGGIIAWMSTIYVSV